MKRIKFLLALLIVMLGTAVQAQTVVVYKDGKVVDEFQPEQVDSVVYTPKVDRNVYSDAACTQILFDASKVVTGKTSIAGEAWADYSQYVVRTTDFDMVIMKIPFIVYYKGVDGTCKVKAASEIYEGIYWVGGITNLNILISTNK